MSPLLAQSGHALVRCTRPLSGVKRTLECGASTSKRWASCRGRRP